MRQAAARKKRDAAKRDGLVSAAVRRRLAATLAVSAASLLAAGCGGTGAESPLDEALGYLPADAPLAVVVDTDLESDQFEAAGDAIRGVPFAPLLIRELRGRLEGDGVDFEDDIEPLLGNEAVIAVAEPRNLLAEDVEGFVAALQTKDAGRLEELAADGNDEIGDAEGATLYRDDDDTFLAVKDEVLVIADSEERVRAALERRETDERLREEDVDRAFEDLPADAAVRLYVNVEALLEADPATATARRVPFVEAAETFAATATVADGGEAVSVDFALRTGDGELGAEDLPLAEGDEAPPVIGRDGEIGAGIRNPAQIVKFAEAVGQAISPQGFADYQTAKRQIAQGLDVDLDRDLIDQFTGAASVAVDLDGTVSVRSELANPRAFERTLEKLVRVIPSFAEGAGLGEVGVARPGEGEDFYAVAAEGGGGVVYGVVDDVFVLSTDARRAADLAAEQPQRVEGAEGALVLRADAGELARVVIAQIAGPLGGLVDLPLGLLTGSVRSGDDGLRGRVSLDLTR